MFKFLTVRGAALIAVATLTGCASATALERPLAASAPTVVTQPQVVEAVVTPPALLDTPDPTPAPTPVATYTAIPVPTALARLVPPRPPVVRAIPAAVQAPPPPRPPAAAAVRPLTAASGNWSGYVASGSFWEVAGSWTEPTVRCTAPDATLALWVGLGGDGSLPLYQAGSGAMCRNGSPPVHFLWYELLTAAQQPPQVIVREIAPGDTVSISVNLRGAGGGGAIQLADRTAGYTTTVGFTPQATTLGTAEWITEATTSTTTGKITPLADFGTAAFHSSTANQGTEGLASAQPGRLTALTLHDVSGGTAVPGALSPDGTGPGGSFSVSYQQ
jgi:hypothetical protein